jgi:hypothetical protein
LWQRSSKVAPPCWPHDAGFWKPGESTTTSDDTVWIGVEIYLWANGRYHIQYTGGVYRQLSIADTVHCIYIEIMTLYILCAIDLQDYIYYQLTTPVNIYKMITLTCFDF